MALTRYVVDQPRDVAESGAPEDADGVALRTAGELAGAGAAPPRVAVFVAAADPVSRAGVVAQLAAASAALLLVELPEDADVAVVVEDGGAGEAAVSSIVSAGLDRVVLVSASSDPGAPARALRAGACSLVLRRDATATGIAAAVGAAAAGQGAFPPELLRDALEGRSGVAAAGSVAPPLRLGEREVAVLRLVADGYGTAEIAARLAYSERTVKNVLHDVTNRYQLRNRAHAVALAVRCGAI